MQTKLITDLSATASIILDRKINHLLAVLAGIVASAAMAQSTQIPPVTGFEGFWEATDKTVIEFKRCANDRNLCGHIVLAAEYGTDTANPIEGLRKRPICGLQIVGLAEFDGKMWRQGWTYDPLDGKSYKSVLRLRDGKLYLRSFIGTEVFGETETLSPLPKFDKQCKQ